MRKKGEPSSRARQFMPFAALKGYDDLLRQREQRRVAASQGESLEIRGETLSRRLLSLKPGDRVSLRCFEGGFETKREGVIRYVDVDSRVLRLACGEISFDDLVGVDFDAESDGNLPGSS